MDIAELKSLVRTVPDFPTKGIQFRDLTTLLANGPGFADCITHLSEKVGALQTDAPFDAIAGIEARGFIFGAAVAARLGLGFLPLRKPGKLPVPTLGVDYALEYGQDRLELDPSMISRGDRIIIIDDLIATGGTAVAAVKLLREAGAVVDHVLCVIDLPQLHGSARLHEIGVTTDALMEFAGD